MRSIRSQIVWCARAQWTMTFLMVSLGGLFFIFGYRPANQRIANLKAEIAAKTQRLDTNQYRAQNLNDVAREVDHLRFKLDKFNKKLPRTAELGEFIRDLSTVSSKYTIGKLVYQPGTVRRQDVFGEVPITMTFEGDFGNVFSFLRHLEEMQRLARIKSLQVHGKDGKLGQVDVTMAVNIYFSEL
jgi:Tfp pilus assembly protein PilO